jgi:hypothetical protein
MTTAEPGILNKAIDSASVRLAAFAPTALGAKV